MPPRNPFTVLELPLDADSEAIKAAWRRLARQHHPDLTSGDEALERRATRRMAEINAAYVELKDPARRRRYRAEAARMSPDGRARARAATTAEEAFGGRAPDRPATWEVGPRPTRPVTARIDTSALYRPRNSTLQPQKRSPLPGHPPRPRSVEGREPPRASTPSGPTHRRPGPTLEGDLPTLREALRLPIRFGKFAGLTLGDVADLEPTYVDWIVRTINRDAHLSLAARVVLKHLERTGQIRRQELETPLERA
jgi:curved DNA-binding protein CbpA